VLTPVAWAKMFGDSDDGLEQYAAPGVLLGKGEQEGMAGEGGHQSKIKGSEMKDPNVGWHCHRLRQNDF